MKSSTAAKKRTSFSADVLAKNMDNNNQEATNKPPPSHFTTVIDRDLAKQHKVSSTTIRVLLNNTTGDAIFKEILSCWGIALSEDDEVRYRILLQSKLWEDTKQLCRQLENLDLVKTLDVVEDDATTATATNTTTTTTESSSDNHNGESNHGQHHDTNNDDGEEAKTSNATTPRDAFDELQLLFQQQQNGNSLGANAPLAVKSASVAQGTSALASANAQRLIQYARLIQILWKCSATEKLYRFQKLHPEWSPLVPRYTHDDILRLTSPTFRPGPHDLSGVPFPFPVITKLQLDDLIYEIHDIGGMSSSQRKRLAYCFDQTDIFIFAAALTHYDEPVVVVPSGVGRGTALSTNRLAAALEEFRFFLQPKGTSPRIKRPIVILTRKESFISKLNYTSLSDQASFADFDGTPFEAVNYFINKFKSCTNDGVLDVSDNDKCRMQFFADSTRGVLMFENLRRSGFLNIGDMENMLKDADFNVDDD